MLLAAKRATWQFIGGTLPGTGGAGETSQVVDSASEENFRSFVLHGLLRDAGHSVSERILQAMALASNNIVADLPKIVAALKVNELARRVFVRSSDVEEIESSVSGFLNVAKRYTSTSSLLEALLQYDYAAKAKSQKESRIVLSNIESSKGLEFDHVIVPGVNKGSFDGNRPDERSFFYVAASRARNLLTITHATGRASEFLASFPR
jgi:DNA helicase-2/ATP-dependent DNA helicase PcrA